MFNLLYFLAYLACAFNDDKPNCVKADVVIPGEF